MTLESVYSDSGLSPATVHNVLDERSASPRSKQAITDAIQKQIWPKVPLSRRKITLPAGLEIEFPDEALAIRVSKEFAGVVSRVGPRIKFVRPCEAFLKIPPSQAPND